MEDQQDQPDNQTMHNNASQVQNMQWQPGDQPMVILPHPAHQQNTQGSEHQKGQQQDQPSLRGNESVTPTPPQPPTVQDKPTQGT